MSNVKWTVLLFVIYFMSAAMHESDMARNCAETGNAKAWLYDIKCEVVDNENE